MVEFEEVEGSPVLVVERHLPPMPRLPVNEIVITAPEGFRIEYTGIVDGKMEVRFVEEANDSV